MRWCSTLAIAGAPRADEDAPRVVGTLLPKGEEGVRARWLHRAGGNSYVSSPIVSDMFVVRVATTN